MKKYEKKLPAMFFYTGDWWKDMSAVSPEIRGVWFDLLCRMHDDHRSGIVSGTRDELAALARCTRKQFDDFLLINFRLKFADVTLGNKKETAIVTVKNRRMYREAQSRASVARRVAKSRREEMKQQNGGNVTEDVTVPVRKKRPPYPSSSSSSSSSSVESNSTVDTTSPEFPTTENSGGGDPSHELLPLQKTPTDHQRFIRAWCMEYQIVNGRAYKFQSGKDGAAVKSLLATKATVEELIGAARQAWLAADGFWCKHAATVAGFNSHFNDILHELQTPKKQNGKSDQLKRAEYDPASPGNRESARNFSALLQKLGIGAR